MDKKLAVLRIGDGNFEQGFQVTLSIAQDGRFPSTMLEGRLPAAPIVIQLYEFWQFKYRSRGSTAFYRELQAPELELTRRSSSLQTASDDLQKGINQWLNSSDREFQRLRNELLRTLVQSNVDVRLIVQADDVQLWQLPWHLWDVLENHPNVEVAFSPKEFASVGESAYRVLKAQVKILVILGDSTNINVLADLELLQKQLPDAYIWAPTNLELEQLSDNLWTQNWDILFYAGHSSSDEGDGKGKIYIDSTGSLTIGNLKHPLKKAIKHGLQLAFFNSCNGVGLARDLADLQIPVTLFMRERVPDEVAQKFLGYFLKAFATERMSLYASVRYARDRLSSLEDKYPCASWLPVICQNPAAMPPTWQELYSETESHPVNIPAPILPQKPIRLRLACISLAVTFLIMGMRLLGILQSSELKALDHFMQLRPTESADERILLVGVDEEDIRKYNHPLPDAILAQLIDKIQGYDPIVIGLDIYRDKPVPPGHEAIVTHFQQNKFLIAPCAFAIGKKQGVAPPPQSPKEQLGFLNLLKDGDNTVRRYYLYSTPNITSSFDDCNTNYSLSFQLARKYLWVKGIPVNPTEKDWQLGKVVFKRLEPRSGGYQNLDAKGNQILLNYRNSTQIARQLTVTDILNNKFDPNWIKDKIVIVGVTATSVPDPFDTPYGEKRGLFIHAQIVSHILSSAIDDQHLLLWWVPQWVDAIWVWVWSLTGGLLIWRWHLSPQRLWLAVSISIIVLYGTCLGFFMYGGWLPLIPSAIALLVTAVAVKVYSTFPNRPSN